MDEEGKSRGKFIGFIEPYDYAWRASFRTLKLGEVFSHVHVIPCDPTSPSASDNVIVVATDAACDLTGETTVPVASGTPVITDANAGNLARALFR